MLVFFTSLYAMGVNALIVEMNGEKASMQVGDIVKRKSPDDMPQDVYKRQGTDRAITGRNGAHRGSKSTYRARGVRKEVMSQAKRTERLRDTDRAAIRAFLP